MKSFKEYLMENRPMSFWKSVNYMGLKISSEYEIRHHYGDDFMDAIYDAMNEDGPGVDAYKIYKVYLCPHELFSDMWKNEPSRSYQIAAWYDKGKTNIISYKQDKKRYAVIMNFENNPHRNITFLDINKINPPDNYIVVVDYRPY